MRQPYTLFPSTVADPFAGRAVKDVAPLRRYVLYCLTFGDERPCGRFDNLDDAIKIARRAGFTRWRIDVEMTVASS